MQYNTCFTIYFTIHIIPLHIFVLKIHHSSANNNITVKCHYNLIVSVNRWKAAAAAARINSFMAFILRQIRFMRGTVRGTNNILNKLQTSSSAGTESPHDALGSSVASFNNVIARPQSFSVVNFSCRFTTAYN